MAGAVCLLTASKLNDTRNYSISEFLDYTQNTNISNHINYEDLIKFE